MNSLLYSMYQHLCVLVMKGISDRGYRQGKIDREWKKLLYRAAEESPSIHTYKVFRSFLGDQVILQKRARTENTKASPAIICVLKNSLVYMKKFIPYYRELGVRHFIFVDNGSTDGTLEYLREQEDVTLLIAPYPYEYDRMSGWQLQAIKYAGIDKWYLRLDADEFLTWENMEGSSIPELIAKMESGDMGTYRVVMADMYPSYSLMDGKHDDEDFMDDYIFFDGDASYSWNSETGDVFGGMRRRTAGANLRMDKYVIFHPGRGCIPLPGHSMSGIHNEEEKKIRGILRHYKFLPSEREKYHFISTQKRSGYSSFKQVSKYKKMVEGSITVYTEKSIRYESSKSIRKISFIEPL